MTSPMHLSRAVYHTLWEVAQPLSLPGEPAEAGLRTLLHPTAALAQLADRHFEADLLSAGVAVGNLQGGIRLASPIAYPGEPMMAVREESGGPPIDLITQRGALSGGEMAVALLRDCHLCEALRYESRYLFVVFTVADLAALRASLVPTILFPGAAALTLSRIRSLCVPRETILSDPRASGESDVNPASEEFSISTSVATTGEEPAEPRSSAGTPPGRLADCPGREEGIPNTPLANGRRPWSPMLVVTAWSPAAQSADAPAGLRGQLDELARLQRTLPFDFPALCIWSPNEDLVADLLAARKHLRQEELRDVTFESVEKCGQMLQSVHIGCNDLDYFAARQAYSEALDRAGSAGLDLLDPSCLAYKRSFEHHFVAPLLKQAANCPRPAKRALYGAMAEMSRIIHDLSPLAIRDLNDLRQTASSQRTRDFLNAVKLLVATAKELP